MSQGADTAAAARTTIVFCLLGAVCEGFDLQAAGVAAAGIAGEFRPTPDQLGSFFSASTLGLFFGALIGGRLSDRIGRKAVLVASIASFGVFSLLTAFAWDISSLAWARLLTGFGLGGALPNLIALTAESASANRQNASVALVYSGNPLGGAIASLISLLVIAAHWRWIFIAGGIAPLLLAPIMAVSLQESAAFRRSRAPLAAAAPPAAGAAGFSIFSDGRTPWTLLLWISFFLGLLTLYLLLNWLPTLMHDAGMTRAQAAGTQIGFNVGGALAALAMGRLLEGPLRKPSIILTFVALPALILLLAKAPLELMLVVGIVFLLGCAVIAAQAFLYAQAPAGYPTLIRGVGVGAAVAIGRMGSIVGPKLGGMLKAAGHSSSQLLLDIMPIVILASICALWLAWYPPRPGGWSQP
jgi:MFS transporter, AAHS family, 3-hydroxyphenylpropionic acid transporter